MEGWGSFDSIGDADSASVDGGDVVFVVEAEHCRDCVMVEIAELVEADLGTSDSLGRVGSASADEDDGPT